MGNIITKHYNSEVELAFDEGRHIYFANGVKADGVTTCLGIIAKPALIAWSAKMAAEHFKDNVKPGEALDELRIASLFDEMKAAHRKKKEKAGDVGHLVHEWCEKFSRGEHPELPVNEEVKGGVNAFLKWVTDHHVEFLSVEKKVYSRKHNVAGTFDALARVDGKKVLLDYKTGSGIYGEMGFQLAAYRLSLEEEFPDEEPISHGLIVNIQKGGDLQVREFHEYEKDRDAFLNALYLNRRMQEV